jgi:hypothetical protein
MRDLICSLPLQEVERVCDGCIQAFWTNCVAGPEPEPTETTKH